MGVELPAELAEIAAAVGLRWPRADEDAMRAQAEAWREARRRLEVLAEDADRVGVLDAMSGPAGEAARTRWAELADPDRGAVADLARAADAAAARLAAAAEQVGAAKVEMVRRLVAAAENVAAARAAAAAGHPAALLGVDTVLRGAAANLAALSGGLAAAVGPGGGSPVAALADVAVSAPGARTTDGQGGLLAAVTGLPPAVLDSALALTGSGGDSAPAGDSAGPLRDLGPVGTVPRALVDAAGGLTGEVESGDGGSDVGRVVRGVGGVVAGAAGGVPDAVGAGAGGWGPPAGGAPGEVGDVVPGGGRVESGDGGSGLVGAGTPAGVSEGGDASPGARPEHPPGPAAPTVDEGTGPIVLPRQWPRADVAGPAYSDAPTPPAGLPRAPEHTVAAGFTGGSFAAVPNAGPLPPGAAPAGPQGGAWAPAGPDARGAPAPAPVAHPMPAGPLLGSGGHPFGNRPAPLAPGAAPPAASAVPFTRQPGAGAAQPVRPRTGGSPPVTGVPPSPGRSAAGAVPPARHGGTGVAPPDHTVGAAPPASGPGVPPATSRVPGQHSAGQPERPVPPGQPEPRPGPDRGEARPLPVPVGTPRQERDSVVALFLVHMFPIGHLPVARHRPARQLPLPPPEADFAAGLRFPPHDHPDSAAIDPGPVLDRIREGRRYPAPPPAGVLPRPPAALTVGHDPLGGLVRREWDRRYLVHTDRGAPEHAWPPGERYPEGGCAPGDPVSLPEGTVIDRFGTAAGRVFAPSGTPFAERSLPPTHLSAGYRRYRVLRELPVWRSVSAGWFGQPGGGTRLRAVYSAAELVTLGYLADITFQEDA
ncbi:Protein of unknown function [Amycolatopsis arida]|uniref:DUF4237 domain-containing protein n=1 Tax=Amycolatopsis arida TaxID=587909 RepID=A0A1I5WPL8_9PSEU|nr:glycohydrolase toxin TNT-related protein [Amycolatopsis arida]TDX92370.1 uncharacterized protein DUF4237 [Amycolatopsis arida]SFQ21336.1 Protein of unknown function [Amycolatopsis arida]